MSEDKVYTAEDFLALLSSTATDEIEHSHKSALTLMERDRERFVRYFPNAKWDSVFKIFLPESTSVIYLGWLAARIDAGAIPDNQKALFMQALNIYKQTKN